MRAVVGWLALMLAGPVAAQEPAAEESRRVVEKILQAWKARQSGVRSFEWIVEGQLFYPQKSQTMWDGALAPDRDLLLPLTCKITGTGDDWRVEETSWTLDAKGSAVKWPRLISRVRGEWRDHTLVNGNFTIGQKGTAFLKPNGALNPVWWFVRPLDVSVHGFDLARVSLVESQSDFQGEACYVVRAVHDPVRTTKSWLTRRSPHSLVRHLEYTDGRLTQEFRTEEYDRQSGCPVAWVVRVSDRRGNLSFEWRGRQTRFTQDANVQADALVVTPPPRALVRYDGVSSADRAFAVVQSNGEVRPLPPQDWGADIEQIEASEPGYALRGNGAPSTGVVVKVILVVTCLGFVVRLIRRRIRAV